MMLRDLRYAVRVLRGTPAFTAAAVLTLALGIGANTALFSVVDEVLLKSLPVRDPGSLVVLAMHTPRGERNLQISYPLYTELAARNTTLAGLVAVTAGGDRMPVQIPPAADGDVAVVSLASLNFFEMLGVHATPGRVFSAEDGRPDAPLVVVLSHRYWTSRLAASPSAIGRTLHIQNVPFTIVGVAPPGFFGNVVGESPDMWTTTSAQPRLWLNYNFLTMSSVDWLNVMGRLRPGVTLRQAQESLDATLRGIEREWSGAPRSEGLPRGGRIVVDAGARGFSDLRERFDRPLRLLMIVVGLVLLGACVNVAGLLVARSAAAEREIAIRMALGARPRDVARQFLAQSLLLSLMGGIAGVLLSLWGTDALLPLLGTRAGETPLSVSLDLRLLAFASATSLATGLAFGTLPICRYVRRQSHAIGGGAAARPRLLLGKALVVTQIALSLVLVIGAGLFVRTLQKLRDVGAGFDTSRVVMARIDAGAAGYTPEQVASLAVRLRSEIEAIPGVQSMSQSEVSVMSGRSRICCITVPGYSPAPDERMEIRTNDVTPSYFSTVGMPLRAGRGFSDGDGAGVVRPVIVNEAFERKYFAGAPATGRSFAFGKGKPIPIVGVVADARYDGLRAPILPLVFFPAAPDRPLQFVEVRTSGDSRAVVGAIRRALLATAPGLPVREMFTVEQLIDASIGQERLLARLAGLFGLLALSIACVGLYGLLAQLVAQRTNEIGIRIALGAERRQVAALVLRESGTLLIAGLSIGIVAALASTRATASLLYGISATDPVAVCLAVACLAAAAVAASLVPAWRAATVSPLTALRQE